MASRSPGAFTSDCIHARTASSLAASMARGRCLRGRGLWLILAAVVAAAAAASQAMGAPSDAFLAVGKRSLSSLARTSQLPQGAARQHGGDKRSAYGGPLFGYGPFLQDVEARRVREAALREALIRRLNRGDVYGDDDNGVLDKRNVAALARDGVLRTSAAQANAKRNVAALLRQTKYGTAPSSSDANSGHHDEEDREAYAGSPQDVDTAEKRHVLYGDSDDDVADLVDAPEYDDEELYSVAPAKRFLGRIPNMGRHRPKQTSGGSGIKTSRRRPHSS